MSYSINEVPLDNDTFGWTMMRGSQPLLSVVKRLSAVEVPGRHGVLSGVPAFNSAPTETLVIRTPKAGLEPLYALFQLNQGLGYFRLTDDSTRAALFELAAISPQGINAEDETVDVTVTLRFPSSNWRDVSRTTMDSTSVTDPVQDFEILDGISSDIIDGDIFVGGNFGNFELLDAGSGSWLKTIKTWPHVADTGLLYIGGTGQAFRATTAAPWTPTDDMSDYIDVSGGGGFRISPTWVADPSDRVASLELTTTNQSGVTFRVRAYNAFALRNGGI